jgi:hypothetical protein
LSIFFACFFQVLQTRVSQQVLVAAAGLACREPVGEAVFSRRDPETVDLAGENRLVRGLGEPRRELPYTRAYRQIAAHVRPIQRSGVAVDLLDDRPVGKQGL